MLSIVPRIPLPAPKQPQPIDLTAAAIGLVALSTIVGTPSVLVFCLFHAGVL